MVVYRYGPWLQGDDFQREVSWSSQLNSTPKHTMYELSVDREQDDFIADQPRVDEVTLASAASVWDAPFTFSRNVPVQFLLNRVGGILPPWQFRYRAARNFTPIPFSAWWPHVDAGPWPTSANTNPVIPFSEWPAGAVGYEYETSLADVIACALRLEYTGLDYDDSSGTEVAHNGAGAVEIRHAAGVFDPLDRTLLTEFDAQAAVTQPVVDSFTTSRGVSSTRNLDATPALFGNPPDGFVVLLTSYRVDTVPTLNDLGSDGGGFGMGAPCLGGWADYTFRPALHRFIFERAPGLPPCRVFPRDDGLAASAGPRVWPPPRSQQVSNRVGPGSYW